MPHGTGVAKRDVANHRGIVSKDSILRGSGEAFLKRHIVEPGEVSVNDCKKQMCGGDLRYAVESKAIGFTVSNPLQMLILNGES